MCKAVAKLTNVAVVGTTPVEQPIMWSSPDGVHVGLSYYNNQLLFQ